MKILAKILSFVFFLFAPILAQNTHVFFSEYLEGTSSNGVYNRALEIYNASDVAVDMSSYFIKSGYSGNNNEWNDEVYTFPEGTVLQPGEVFVLANDGSADSILAVADDTVRYNTYGYVVAFSGDDARGLFQIVNSDTVLIDIIGVHGEVPDNGGWDVAGVPQGTKDHTLVRKSNVSQGETDWNVSAGTNENDSQWIVYPKDTFTYLGWHQGPVDVDEASNYPKQFILQQNYPNPFNPTTTINYVIASPDLSGRGNLSDGEQQIASSQAPRNDGAVQVTLKVYDMLGREVSTLVNKLQAPGNYSVQLNATNLPSGIYFYTLKAGNFVQTRKMILMK